MISAEPDSRLGISRLPGLAELWAETRGDRRVRIAVLDGPVDQSHPCFEGAELERLPTLVMEPAGSGRMSAHGTHISSMIFGQHTSPIHGLAPDCSGIIVPIFSDRKPGPTNQLELARAINQAIEAGAHVINISGGELSHFGNASPMLASAVEHCNDKGVLIVAAAGNDACECLHVPAALPSVLAVGALDAQGVPLDSSNWGRVYRSQGIMTLGDDMLGATPGGGFALKEGTSFATPVVTGVVALLLSSQLKRGDKPNPHEVRTAILSSATKCNEALGEDCRRLLAGRLNIPGAYALISKGEFAMSDEQKAADMAEHNDIHQMLPSHSDDLAVEPVAQQVDVAPLQPCEVTGSDVVVSDTPSSSAEAQTATSTTSSVGLVGSGVPASTLAHASIAAPATATAVTPAACSCQANGGGSSVFAIGVLGYDFGTEAGRDAFKQLMPNVTPDGIPFVPTPGQPPADVPIPPNPYDARQIVNYLGGFPPAQPPYPTEGGFPRITGPGQGGYHQTVQPLPPEYPGYSAHLSEAAELIWTLNIELTPIYAIRPSGNFGPEAYQRLVASLAGQILPPDHKEYVERVSIPGTLTGESVRLYSGQVVPVIEPQVRGFYSWNTNVLLDAAVEACAESAVADEAAPDRLKVAAGLRQFLNRLYYDLRNLGQTSAERALNFSATNAFQAAAVFVKALQADKATLDTITIERSSFCRMDSDCWDVKFVFFDPENDRRSRKVFRYTVDVSGVYPVTMGPIREWDISG